MVKIRRKKTTFKSMMKDERQTVNVLNKLDT